MLYGATTRVEQRTSLLKRAKIAGDDPLDVIIDLARRAGIRPDANRLRVLDVGCGRGGSTARLAHDLNPAMLVALDLSPAMLQATRQRTTAGRVECVCADFHAAPIRSEYFDLAVAAFCLYHSTHPEQVVGQLAACLRPSGIAIAATKSADSYRALDELVHASGLDPHALERPSLYVSFHTGNAIEVMATALRVEQLLHDHNRFVFPTLRDVAAYLATSPKYQLPKPGGQAIDLDGIERALRQVHNPGLPLAAESTVTYCQGRRHA